MNELVSPAISTDFVDNWMSRLRSAWEAGSVDQAMELFKHTQRYYERPFYAAESQQEIRQYWGDISAYKNIRVEYTIVALQDSTAVVHFKNWFTANDSDKEEEIDGVFIIKFSADGECVEFRQWWFARN